VKEIVARLDSADIQQLRKWVVDQLRGQNPGELRQTYEATHYPIAAMYRFFSPVTRESLQSIMLELMRATAKGSRNVPPHELFALVDPIFASSSLQSEALDVLLSIGTNFSAYPDLRHPTLVAVRRIGYKGTAVWWKSQLKGENDEALVTLLEGIAAASLTEFFTTVRSMQWSKYIADCVASLTPWMIEEFGNEAVLPRLMHLLVDQPQDLQRPIVAMIGAEDLQFPRSDTEWRVAIEAFVSGESDVQPWDSLTVAPPRWVSIAAERIAFNDALRQWLGSWMPDPANTEPALRLIGLLRAHPSDAGIATLIGALDVLTIDDARAEPFFRESLKAISSSAVSVRQLWRKDENARTGYARWLVRALAVPNLRNLAVAETVRWLDVPDASPYLEMISAGGISVYDLKEAVHKAGMSERTILMLLVEILRSAITAENDKIVKEIKAIEPDIAQKTLRLEEERGGGMFTQTIRRGRPSTEAHI
jgi:hypothetical protein